MEDFEIKLNEEALVRRAKRKPSPKKNSISIRLKYCKGCGMCVNICPTGTLTLIDDKENKFGVSAHADAPEYCIGCKMCESRCPDFAIFINYRGKAGEK